MLTRLPFVVATGVGIGLLGVLLVASQLSASRAADDLVTGATPFVSESGLARMRADLEKAELVAAAIQDDGLRRLAALSGETQAELLAAVEARHPELIVALSQAPASEQLAEKVISNLEARRDQFDSAASLPGLGLELHDGVIAQFALATFLVIVGVVGMVRPRRALASVVVAVGVSLVATPLALDHPAKTADTDHLLDSLRPFTAEKVQARRDALKTARRLFNGFRHEVVPEVAARACKSGGGHRGAGTGEPAPLAS